MSDAVSLLLLTEPGAPRAEAARARLGERFRVVALDAREGLETFNLLAVGGASRAVATLAREAGARLRAVVLESPDAPGASDTLTVPTLIVLGTRDGEAAQAAGRAWADRTPGAHLVYVYDAGHAIGEDRPEAFAEVVGDFFERQDAFVISRSTTVIHP